MKAIILAAGMGTRLAAPGGIPKCMVEVAGTSLIDRMIQRIGQAGIQELVVVTGYRADDLRKYVNGIQHPLAKSATFVHNDRYAEWGNFYSLLVTQDVVGSSSFVKLDGDVILDEEVLPRLLRAQGSAVLAVDCKSGLGQEEMKVRLDDRDCVTALNKQMDPEEAIGEFIGVERIDSNMTARVFAKLRELITVSETHEYYERAYEKLAQEGTPFHIADVTGCTWTEIDNAADLANAQEMCQ